MKLILKKFNELNTEEIYDILKLRNEVFIVEQECAYQDCDGRDKNAYHLMIIDDGEIASYLRILGKGVSYNEISIGRVIVNPKYRKKGLARKMMLKALEFIQNELNEDSIRIEAQAYLVKFYESLGFKKVSEVFLEDNIPHVEMLFNNL